MRHQLRRLLDSSYTGSTLRGKVIKGIMKPLKKLAGMLPQPESEIVTRLRVSRIGVELSDDDGCDK